MRASDSYFFLVPTPAGLGAFFTQHEWLVAMLITVFLVLLGAFIRLLNFFIEDVEKRGGFWSWYSESLSAREDREKFRDSKVIHDEGRRMRRLEGAHQRREYKRRNSSRADQLKLFRW